MTSSATTSRATTLVQGPSSQFERILQKFKAELTDSQKGQFQVTTEQDLLLAIQEIQDKHGSKRKMRGMHRLEVFLEGMKEYGEVIQVFVNTSEILAFVWGPMKFLLQVANTYKDAFNTLLDAYQRIGEHLPLIRQYENLSKDQPQMERVLSLMYEDILEFHWKAMRYFQHKMWKQLFHALWKRFGADFDVILKNLEDHRNLMNFEINIMQYTEMLSTRRTQLASAEEIETLRRRESVYSWLSAAKFNVDQETFQETRRQYPDTGNWLLRKPIFQDWFDPTVCKNNMLWINGIPGAGKTILASAIVEEARKIKSNHTNISIAFFYCRYQDETRNTFCAVARGILAQLLHQDDSLLAHLYETALKSGSISLDTDELAMSLLEVAIKNCEKLYVIIDGIDECRRKESRKIGTFFQSTWGSFPPDDAEAYRCLFISQDDGQKDFAKVVPLKIATADSQQDIRSYARKRSEEIRSAFHLSDDRRQEIENMITERSDGMFLFAKLLSSFLLRQPSVQRLEDELQPGIYPKGPSRLTELYARIMQSLNTEDSPFQNVTQLLGWLVCARRPLKWREIQSAVAINVDEQTVEWEKKRIVADPKKLFGSLVEVQADDTVSLVHQTAKRYLVETKTVNVAAEELTLALLCVNYLTFPGFFKDFRFIEVRLKGELGYYGFVDYACAYWSRHVEKALSTSRTEDEIQELAETLGVFIDMHWKESHSVLPIPRSILQSLKSLKQERSYEKLACAVYLARKYLHAPSGKPTPEEQVLQLEECVESIRRIIEQLPDDASCWKEQREVYGTEIYKCPRLHCARFYNGFPTKQLRKDHVAKHERSFFCSYSGCPYADLGCASLKELQKHEREVHDAFDVDEGEEFPELPPEKVSFECTLCNAKFTRKHNLKNHMRTHEAPDQKSFVCATCGEKFARQGDRTRHISTKHSEAKRFTCGGELKSGAEWGCGRVFNRADVLSRHYRSERGRMCRLPLEEEEAASTSVSTPLGSTQDAPQGTEHTRAG